MNYSRAVTKRFLIAFDRIRADRTTGKITQAALGEILGISSTNINRLRTSEQHNVTLEACCKICDLYKVSPAWLLMGIEENDNDFEKRITLLERKVYQISKKLAKK